MSEPTLYLVAIAGTWALFLWAGNRIFGPFPNQYRPIERKYQQPFDIGTAITGLSETIRQFGLSVSEAMAGLHKAIESGLLRTVPGDIIDIDGRWHVVLTVSADGAALTTKPAGLWLRFRLWRGDLAYSLWEWLTR